MVGRVSLSRVVRFFRSNMRRRAPLFRLAIVASISAFTGWYAAAPSITRAAPVLISVPRADASAPVQLAPDPTAVRSRYVTIEVAALPASSDRGPAHEPALPLDLFPDVSVRALFDRFDPNATGVTWVGHVEGVPMSSVTVVYGDGLLAGSVVTPTASYSIRPAPEIRTDS
jgi:hypothetical protein